MNPGHYDEETFGRFPRIGRRGVAGLNRVISAQRKAGRVARRKKRGGRGSLDEIFANAAPERPPSSLFRRPPPRDASCRRQTLGIQDSPASYSLGADGAKFLYADASWPRKGHPINPRDQNALQRQAQPEGRRRSVGSLQVPGQGQVHVGRKDGDEKGDEPPTRHAPGAAGPEPRRLPGSRRRPRSRLARRAGGARAASWRRRGLASEND